MPKPAEFASLGAVVTLDTLRRDLRGELEAPADSRKFGQGWLSGVFALVLALGGLFLVICLRFPALFTVPEIRAVVDVALFRVALHVLLITAFVLAVVSLGLRKNKLLGLSAIVVTLAATALGGSRAQPIGELTSGVYFGLDWFLLNLALTGIVFLPLERAFGRRPQEVFRFEWREDLLYFLISSLLVQSLTYLTMAPASAVLHHTQWDALRNAVRGQPLWLQFVEIMFLTDFVQYWLHRAFHKVPFLWGFHSIHHSAPVLDWLAGSRMHFFEIVCLRATTILPTIVLGFDAAAMYAYLVVVYVYATYLHSNVRFDIEWLKPLIATPRFHHWHHGLEHEAVDVNFAIHFPILDRVFGTYHMPKGRWPAAYGVEQPPVPSGFAAQFAHPFRRRT